MTRVPNAPARDSTTEADPTRLAALDVLLLVLFLGLVFLLGVFPLKDVDFWWHLRTGDWIRATGAVPRHDLYTYTVPENRWIDLHWIFQVLLSLGYEHGGVVLLNLAKCAVTTAAMLLLITSRRREWPLWVMVLAWLPALVLLSGRMYIRPETLTLFYLAVFLAVLPRLGRSPRLVFVLPITQLAWVNSQGLFVFGPVVLAMSLVDYALGPGQISGDLKRWWRIVMTGTALTALACLLNPYGFHGALFPVTLFFGTMSDPIFKETIAELSSISKLIADTAGYPLFMLQVHLAVAWLAGASFIVPVLWLGFARMKKAPAEPEPERPAGKAKGEGKPKKPASKKAAQEAAEPPLWRLSVFRLLLFVAFGYLGWQATRNSHQYAAVLGTITAWNLGEWAAALQRRRAALGLARGPAAWPKLAAIGGVAGMIGLVGTGTLYAWAEEGRTIGLGEEPAWFPHEAIRFAGQKGLPPRFLSLHIGHAALYDHAFGPDRKVFADPRLEVLGPEQYGEYVRLQHAMSGDSPRQPTDWRARLDRAERPVVLIDHTYFAPAGVTLLADPSWKCLWFGPVAAVFAHDEAARAAGLRPVDFLARHYGLEPAEPARGGAEALSAAKGMSHYALRLSDARGRMDLARPMSLHGLDYARQAREAMPESAEPWSVSCALEISRDPRVMMPNETRARAPFDPALDLGPARVASFARRALAMKPDDGLTLASVYSLFVGQGMGEAALPLLERLADQPPRTVNQARAAAEFAESLEQLRAKLGRKPDVNVTNGSEVGRTIDRLMTSGWVVSAADLMEREYPAAERDWPTADRLATIRLRLGEPARAREAWKSIPNPPRPAVQQARVAATYYAEDDLERARSAYREAIAADPGLAEAHLGLAMVEMDAGLAGPAAESLSRAIERTPSGATRDRMRQLFELLPESVRPPVGSSAGADLGAAGR